MAVMISIQPKWVKKIASGIKLWEVRKGKPKLETPFKCYIYCTNDRKTTLNMANGQGLGEKGELYLNGNCYYPYSCGSLNGKVIGEFVCDEIKRFECSSTAYKELATYQTCLTFNEILDYCNGQDLYAWHISDLKIYDQPKEIEKFFVKGACRAEICYKCNHYVPSGSYYEPGDCKDYSLKPLTRPFQSWGYVEGEE